MYRTCSICGRIHKYNEQCKRKSYPVRDSEADKLRAKNIWHEKSKAVRSHYLFCLVCYDQYKCFNYDHLQVHHIVPLKDDPSRLLDDDNLIPLCGSCHNKAEKKEFSSEYLLNLVARYKDNPPAFEGVEI